MPFDGPASAPVAQRVVGRARAEPRVPRGRVGGIANREDAAVAHGDVWPTAAPGSSSGCGAP